MSHGAHVNESRPIHEWIMSHIWMSHVPKYEWVMSHIWMTHVPHTNESWHMWVTESWHTYEWVMSNMNELCHTHEYANTNTHLSRTRNTPTRTSSDSCACFLFMSESCHTHDNIMSHTTHGEESGVYICVTWCIHVCDMTYPGTHHSWRGVIYSCVWHKKKKSRHTLNGPGPNRTWK